MPAPGSPLRPPGAAPFCLGCGRAAWSRVHRDQPRCCVRAPGQAGEGRSKRISLLDAPRRPAWRRGHRAPTFNLNVQAASLIHQAPCRAFRGDTPSGRQRAAGALGGGAGASGPSGGNRGLPAGWGAMGVGVPRKPGFGFGLHLQGLALRGAWWGCAPHDRRVPSGSAGLGTSGVWTADPGAIMVTPRGGDPRMMVTPGQW